ncbi:hypothetical protein [Psychroserpens algicola]|uniref:TIGR02646 family protein n=1 Tax=Psychroserpens algicola TaxID=1719034 RepID=A0ABT0H5K0_9FLAO|nr:hypothetical protein [Psychroserpens algicola]MCK8479657.1 hypothetical protein [Psychroserpens algicola]
MIKIKRTKQPDIAIYNLKNQKLTKAFRDEVLALIDTNSIHFSSFIPRLKDANEKFTKAEKETLQAIAYYGNPAHFANNEKLTKKKAPTFKVYKDSELKEFLKTLFNKKCAYCDSRFLSTSTADIEHFRPKAAFNPFKDNVDEKLLVPGYYWLAADWNNLLWSCVFCNRKNNLDQPNVPGVNPLGKKNRFPLSQEPRRIRSHDKDVKTEKRLLLIMDPCVDNPMKHFSYPVKNDEDLGIVKALIKSNGKPSKKAVASIPIYGLNRTELVIARKEAALDFKSIFMAVLDSIDAFTRKKQAGEDTTEEKERFKFQKDRFNAKLSKSAEYLSMKQFLLEDFKDFPLLNRLGLKIENLID